MNASRPLNQTIVELLRQDEGLAEELLNAAIDEADEPGGREALLAALRSIAEAKGMRAIAEETGLSRETLYRTLSPRGNPTLRTLMAVTHAAGLRLRVEKAHA